MQELEFFDCSTLSAEMIKTLGQIVQAPSFQPSFVRDLSRACETLCCWLRAVYQYACVQHRMAPQMARKQDLDELMVESRERLRVSRLQEMSEHDRQQELEKQLELNRQDMMLLKLELSTAEEHERETSATLKLIERHIEDWNSAEKVAVIINDPFTVLFPMFRPFILSLEVCEKNVNVLTIFVIVTLVGVTLNFYSITFTNCFIEKYSVSKSKHQKVK